MIHQETGSISKHLMRALVSKNRTLDCSTGRIGKKKMKPFVKAV